MQLFRFIIVGFIVNIADYTSTKILLFSGFYAITSKTLSFCIGICLSFILNSIITFSCKLKLKIFLLYLFIYSLSLVVNISIFHYLVTYSLSVDISWFITTIITATINYKLLKIAHGHHD